MPRYKRPNASELKQVCKIKKMYGVHKVVFSFLQSVTQHGARCVQFQNGNVTRKTEMWALQFVTTTDIKFLLSIRNVKDQKNKRILPVILYGHVILSGSGVA